MTGNTIITRQTVLSALCRVIFFYFSTPIAFICSGMDMVATPVV